MKHIVMVAVLVIRSPSPSRRDERGISPRPRERNESATSQRDARTVPRVRLRTRSAMSVYTLPQDAIADSAAGARMTMNSDGKMHPTVGSMMRIGARAAFSSAR